MNTVQKITTGTGSLLALIPAALGHGGSGQAYSHMMGGMMHNTGHMAGYNTWGMGWFGALFSITLWVLAVFGIFYLYNSMNQDSEEDQ